MMKGFDRTLKYSLHAGTRVTIYSLIVGIIYSAYFVFMYDGKFSIDSFLEGFGRYYLFVVMIFIVTFGMVHSVTTVPQQISCGCIRLHAALSLSISNFITIIESVLLLLVYYLAVPQFDFVKCLRSVGHSVSIMLIAAGVASMLMVLVMKYGHIAYIICIVLMAGIVGGISGLLATANKHHFSMAGIEGLLAIIAIVALVLGNAILVTYSKHIEIKG